MKVKSALLLVVLAAGCAGSPSPGAPAPQTAVADPPAIHWTRTSAEQRASFLQAYAWGRQRIREEVGGRAAGTWAVILDADETVIDNSAYQKERAALGLGFSDDTWDAWVRRREATALPGAAEFIATVRSLGGRVVIVTNRTQSQCADTQANFTALRIEVDAMLCRPPETGNKNPRFAAVQNGTAVPSLPPLEVLMWVGDNIQDFPNMTQQIRTADASAFEMFGSRYLILPNPMYGSWERNPAR